MQKFWMMSAVVLAGLFLASAAYAEARIISGGVGESDEELINSVEGNYNVRLLIVGGPRGAYTSDVLVRFIDKEGNVIGRATSEGPIMFAELPAGSYTMEATLGAETITRKVYAKEGGLNRYDVHFKGGDD